MESFKDEIKSCIRDNGIDRAEIVGLDNILNKPSMFSKAVKPISTEYLQVKYFMDKFKFVVGDN